MGKKNSEYFALFLLLKCSSKIVAKQMERETTRFREESAEWLKGYTKLERTQGVIAGILIGTGVGGWVALGLEPWQALSLLAIGGSFGLGGLGIELERQHYEKYRDGILKEFGGKDSSP